MCGFHCLVSDPPPVYTERPAKSKSPERLLVPRLSSVEEFQEPVSPTMDDTDTTTHLHHTPVTTTTTEETVTPQDTNNRAISDTITMATNSAIINEPVIITVDSGAITTTHSTEVDNETDSESSNKPITTDNLTTSSEVAITVTTNEQEEPNIITDNTVHSEVSPSVVGDDHAGVDQEEVEIEVTTM